ncbi:Glycosyl hydrolase family 47 [Geosmithia morbida]|uniref:alpha-1,2-Mannosidase n=1 Tax=Geosmithia morbida TaxID=1094350 RepID=A0A9P5D3K3_9HYPO|nr:Glycosyl hydrolase family 47 [Geosmithia morbida]KAF4125042.1 Glycosyl hydrolase family 47 [Geosmithia morbida]
MRPSRMAELRRGTVDMFYHGWNNYMEHGFPEDELRPITCKPLSRDRDDPTQIGLNDALGNYSLTLIDSLSTLAILAGGPVDDSGTGPKALGDFQHGVSELVRYYGDGRQGPTGQGLRAFGFDLDSKVQVFETVIRGVGGLLSAHLFAIGELPIAGYDPRGAAAGRRYHDGGDGDGDGDDDPLELPPIQWPNGFQYDGQLLRLAFDLGQRLLPAFYTQTGLPYPRVNLRHGIPFYTNSPLHGHPEAPSGDFVEQSRRREITETCSAGAGSLTLEFAVLSRLSGDPRFEQAAKRAFWEVWGRRSPIGLIGNGIDAEHGMWIGPHSGIGAGMDSFFEYALKSHILLSGNDAPNTTTATTRTPTAASHRRPSRTDWLDPNTMYEPLPTQLHSSDAFLEAWHQAHASVKRHIYTNRSTYPYYSNSHRVSGQPYTMWIDSLGAFYPGLLALAGEIDEAIEASLVYTALWTRYSALPERWSFRGNDVEGGIGWWPGRPEFIESTFYIYRATKDPWYLYVGEMVLRDIKWRCWAPCGWAGLQDVRTGEKQDRMESFFLGETTKYMYLLFDPDHALNKLDAPFVFSTEGHPLIIPKRQRHAVTARRSAGRLRKSTTSTSVTTTTSTTTTTTTTKKTNRSSMSTYAYLDETFTDMCPVVRPSNPLSGSVTAARPDLFGVSRFTGLHKAPNVHGPLEAVQVPDKRLGHRVMHRPTSNHTLFPWTLPEELLPPDGMCTAPPHRAISWIEFPTNDAVSSVMSRFGTSLSWLDHQGPTVRNLEGLRLQLEKMKRPAASTTRYNDDGEQDRQQEKVQTETWRITHVGPTELGQHESVFFYAEHVRNIVDEAFTVLRDPDVISIRLMVDSTPDNPETSRVIPPASGDNNSNTTSTSTNSSATQQQQQQREGEEEEEEEEAEEEEESESFIRSFLRVFSSVFEPSYTNAPSSTLDPVPAPKTYTWTAYTPTGPGAFPAPPVIDTPIPGSPPHNARDPLLNLPWRTIYMAGYACDEPLPDRAPKSHQVIVIRRGGCSFSRKLSNIPSFSPSPSSLQLVLVVNESSKSEEEEEDDDDDDDNSAHYPGEEDRRNKHKHKSGNKDKNGNKYKQGEPRGSMYHDDTRPLLDEEQRTPSGLRRPHPIPMVLVSAAPGDYDSVFSRAAGK